MLKVLDNVVNKYDDGCGFGVKFAWKDVVGEYSYNIYLKDDGIEVVICVDCGDDIYIVMGNACEKCFYCNDSEFVEEFKKVFAINLEDTK